MKNCSPWDCRFLNLLFFLLLTEYSSHIPFSSAVGKKYEKERKEVALEEDLGEVFFLVML